MNTIETPADNSELNLEDRISVAAHQIWVDEGQPEGRAEDHWFQACKMIAEEDEAIMAQIEPEWLQRSPEIEQTVEEAQPEKSELSKSIEEIKKRLIGRAA